MELQIIESNGQAAGNTVAVADECFAREFNEALVHQVVVAYLAGGRAGTRAHKNRAAVAGGGAKPWRQKGTGRARAGTASSPLWRGGGRTFAASPQDHSQKVNRKMYRAAMRAIFSELVRQERLVVVDDITVGQPSTKAMVALLKGLGVAERILVVTEEVDLNLFLSARNLPRVRVSDVAGLDPVSLVGSEKVLITVPALKRVGEWLA